MADQDLTIEKAKALLQVGATELAFNTLAKQINVLNADVKMLRTIIDGVEREQKREPLKRMAYKAPAAKEEIVTSDARKWGRAILVVVLLIILFFLVLYGKALLEDMQGWIVLM